MGGFVTKRLQRELSENQSLKAINIKAYDWYKGQRPLVTLNEVRISQKRQLATP